MDAPQLGDDDRLELERLAARLVLDEDFLPASVVAKAADLVAEGFDGPATVELAAQPVDPVKLDRIEVERLFRDLLAEHRIRILGPGEAGWVLAGWTAELIIDGALNPADGALRLWGLWRTCGEPGDELTWMLQLHDAWESSVGADRIAIEREIVAYAPEVLAAAQLKSRPG
ncbi:MAG: hypothetical protein AB1679_31385 [Actinomycetota bacterium]